ncbi:hypothetical protein B6N60_01385 [Richelia sinica FACHB-800]|uniref:Uncharacterized protein n=1 Tax=Richelia sinica FACHB-800 TaxID=1357546 RepID=A0A975T5V9_9NOST|nr:hypothetical protein B6N60_01385 [Richelia sinica FACHB-800]
MNIGDILGFTHGHDGDGVKYHIFSPLGCQQKLLTIAIIINVILGDREIPVN